METTGFNTIDWQTDFRPDAVDDPSREAQKKRRLAAWKPMTSVTIDLPDEWECRYGSDEESPTGTYQTSTLM
ncbi:hypothetical protein C484_00025 [Natrialba taiwanensis DSM 12281]|uniref:Uncharacterized protein n=1 Tax=Natrialba taiwanensis DSM 12281 TaxID=1230458 RepID=M0AFX1_9EURY|nr:hypothetical protein C484_00025 [Natrialba taiwanensis DSM 12281]